MSKKNLNAITALSLSISIVYLWFGFLKFFPELSPAETLAKNTIRLLTTHLIPTHITFILLAIWECLIGFLIALKKTRRIGVFLALVHMAATFSPFLLLPSSTYNESLYSLTLIGQYIIKNIIIVCALFVILPEKERRTF